LVSSDTRVIYISVGIILLGPRVQCRFRYSSASSPMSLMRIVIIITRQRAHRENSRFRDTLPRRTSRPTRL